MNKPDNAINISLILAAMLSAYTVASVSICSAAPVPQDRPLKTKMNNTPTAVQQTGIITDPTSSPDAKDQTLVIAGPQPSSKVTNTAATASTTGQNNIDLPVAPKLAQETMPSYFKSIKSIVSEAKDNIEDLKKKIEHKKIEDEIRSHYEKGLALEKLERYEEAKMEMDLVINLSKQSGFYKYAREQDKRMKSKMQFEREKQIRLEKEKLHRERIRKEYEARQARKRSVREKAAARKKEKAAREAERQKRLEAQREREAKEKKLMEIMAKKQKLRKERFSHKKKMRSDPTYKENHKNDKEIDEKKDKIRKYVERASELYKDGKQKESMKEWQKALELSKTPELHQYLTSLQDSM